MYSTKTATTNNAEFGSSYMPVGINENVTIKGVNISKTANGRDFLEIVFENESGQTASMSEWKNEKNMWIKTDEDLQRRDDSQFGRLLQIIDCLYATRPDFEGSNFLEMITWVKDTIEKAGPTPKLRLKVIYDNKGYTRVSNNGIFVEPMSVTKEDSQIKLFKRDLLERPVVADIESNTDPLSDMTIPEPENNTGADGLPF